MSAPVADADIDHVLRRTSRIWTALRGARIFVTGGTGFVGTWLVEAFAAANRTHDLGAEIVLLTRDPAAFRACAPHLASASGVSLWAGDAADFDAPTGSFSHVIHAATERWYRPDAARPLGIVGDDARATRRVLDFCAAAGVRRLLFTSSGAIYGRQSPAHSRLAETDTCAPDPTDPDSAYGQSKRSSEYSCVAYGSVHGFTATVARLFAFVGPHLPLDAGYAAGNFVRDALTGDTIRIAGDGTPLRSYLYAADLAIWLWHILLRGRPGRAYNVGSPHAVSIAGLAAAVAAAAAKPLTIVTAQTPRAGVLPARYVPCTERVQSELSLDVSIDLNEGLRRTLEWHTRAVRAPLPAARR